MFKHLILLCFILLVNPVLFSQSSTLIKVEGPNGGLVLSFMTGQQRNALIAPENGLVIVNSNTNCLNYYSNGMWFENCGLLIPTCSETTECPSGQICIDGTCINDPNACETSESCPEGQTCVNGQCQ